MITSKNEWVQNNRKENYVDILLHFALRRLEGDIVLHEITSKGCFIQAIKTKYVFETLHSPNI